MVSCLVLLSCPNSCYTLYSVARWFVIVKLTPPNYRLGLAFGLGLVRVPSTAALLLAWRLLLDFGLASTGMCTLFHLGSLVVSRRHCHHHQINARCSVLFCSCQCERMNGSSHMKTACPIVRMYE